MPLIKPVFNRTLEIKLTNAFEKLFLAKVSGQNLGDTTSDVVNEAKEDAKNWGKEIAKVISDEVDLYIKTATVQTTVIPGIPVSAPLGVGFTVGPGSGLGTIS